MYSACDTLCATCGGPFDTECQSCSGDRYLQGGRCVTQCAPGTYAVTSTHQCSTTCPAHFYPNNLLGVCSSESRAKTPPPLYWVINLWLAGCDSTCGTCQITAANCISCSEGRYLRGSSCLVSCPALTYPNEDTNECLSESSVESTVRNHPP